MKVLGETPIGGTIIELSNQETSIIYALQDAIAGARWSPRPPKGIPIEGNIEKAFIAVLNFVEVKYAINELHKVADHLDEIIGISSQEETR